MDHQEQAPSPEVWARAAELYERGKESWLIWDFARRLADSAGVTAGDRVLDVGCGTGIVAKECARRVGSKGSISGLDISEAMLAVARRSAPGIDWYQGDAEELPFPDESFDRVVSQLALMFFADREKAICEMWRVLRPGGTLAVAVLGTIPPAYQRLVEVVERHLDSQAGDIVESRFVLGDRKEVERVFSRAGLDVIALDTVRGVQRFRSPSVFVELEVGASARLATRFANASAEAVARDVERAMKDHLTGDGEVEIPISMHIATAVKPST